MTELYDKDTGQLLYRPRTGRSSQGRSTEIQSSGGLANYLYHKTRPKEQTHHECIRKSTSQHDIRASKNHFSELLLQQKVKSQLESLFYAFSYD